MNLYIQRHPTQTPLNIAWVICKVCDGYYQNEENGFAIFHSQLEPNDINKEPLLHLEYIGGICNQCAIDKTENIKQLLTIRTEDCKYEVKQIEQQLYNFDALFEVMREFNAPIPEWLDDSYERTKNKLLAWNNNTQLYIAFANFISIYRKKSEQPPIKFNGYVYLLGSPEGYCKIGRTKDLNSRISQIKLQLPFRIKVLHSIKVSDPVKAERFLHKKFSHCRKNGEWFQLNAEDIKWLKSLSSLEMYL